MRHLRKRVLTKKVHFYFLFLIILDVILITIMNIRQGYQGHIAMGYSQTELLIAFGIWILQIVWFMSKYLEYYTANIILRYMWIDKLKGDVIKGCIVISAYFVLIYHLLFLFTSLILGYDMDLNGFFYLLSNMVLQFCAFLMVLLLMSIFYVRNFQKKIAALKVLVCYFLIDFFYPPFRYFFIALPENEGDALRKIITILCINLVLLIFLLNVKEGDIIFEDQT